MGKGGGTNLGLSHLGHVVTGGRRGASVEKNGNEFIPQSPFRELF
jgi:hypothetical protein